MKEGTHDIRFVMSFKKAKEFIRLLDAVKDHVPEDLKSLWEDARSMIGFGMDIGLEVTKSVEAGVTAALGGPPIEPPQNVTLAPLDVIKLEEETEENGNASSNQP